MGSELDIGNACAIPGIPQPRATLCRQCVRPAEPRCAVLCALWHVQIIFGRDGNFSEVAFRDTVNACLANSIGNMLNRWG